jgi:hypothetical protein
VSYLAANIAVPTATFATDLAVPYKFRFVIMKLIFSQCDDVLDSLPLNCERFEKKNQKKYFHLPERETRYFNRRVREREREREFSIF